MWEELESSTRGFLVSVKLGGVAKSERTTAVGPERGEIATLYVRRATTARRRRRRISTSLASLPETTPKRNSAERTKEGADVLP